MLLWRRATSLRKKTTPSPPLFVIVALMTLMAVVEVLTPGGRKEFEILGFTTIHDKV